MWLWEKRGRRNTVHGSQTELAVILGISLNNLNMIFTELKNEGKLKKTRKSTIQIIDPDRIYNGN